MKRVYSRRVRFAAELFLLIDKISSRLGLQEHPWVLAVRRPLVDIMIRGIGDRS